MHSQVRAALDAAGAAYLVRRHADYDAPIRSPADFAAALGYPIERITKTIFLRATDSRTYALVTCSVTMKLDLPALARHFGWKRAQMASRDELLSEIGYPPTGVSPLGAARIPVVLDTALLSYPSVLVGGGEAGVEIELAPTALQQATNATILGVCPGHIS